jgi:pimeloyl-ACP methyl ester carboxylesterase
MAIKEIRYKDSNFKLSYEMLNVKKSDSILVLHGWGSNKEIMKQAFSKHFEGYRHIYLDMPGFGASFNADMILETHDYKEIVHLFLEEIGISPMVIMGHSFGGKVATLLNPRCLVLLSSSGILVPKPLNIKIKIAIFKLLKPLGLSILRSFFVSSDARGMSESMYATFKNVVNEDFEHHFQNFTGKALLFWGESDTATPLWTGKRISELIKKSRLYPMRGNHYFFLEQTKVIEKEILDECGGRDA